AAWTVGVSAGLPWPLRPAAAIAMVAGTLAVGWEVVSFPFVFYRSFALDRKYGLSSEPVTRWLADHVKALALGLVLTFGAALAVYGAIHLSPDHWWFIAAALFALVGIVISCLAPIWLLPVFYRVRPLDRDALRERLMRLSARAGVPVLGTF